MKGNDETLVQRVRSDFGRAVSQPKLVDVQCKDGVVTLSGSVPASEVESLVRCAKRVPGVQRVINNLQNQGMNSQSGDGMNFPPVETWI